MRKPLLLAFSLSLAIAPAVHAEGEGMPLFTIQSRDQVAQAEADDAASSRRSAERRRAAREQAEQEAQEARLQALEDERLAAVAWRDEPYWTLHSEYAARSSNCYLNPCYRWSGEWTRFVKDSEIGLGNWGCMTLSSPTH